MLLFPERFNESNGKTQGWGSKNLPGIFFFVLKDFIYLSFTLNKTPFLCFHCFFKMNFATFFSHFSWFLSPIVWYYSQLKYSFFLFLLKFWISHFKFKFQFSRNFFFFQFYTYFNSHVGFLSQTAKIEWKTSMQYICWFLFLNKKTIKTFFLAFPNLFPPEPLLALQIYSDGKTSKPREFNHHCFNASSSLSCLLIIYQLRIRLFTRFQLS